MSGARAVAITGIGSIGPLGFGGGDVFDRLCAGACGIVPADDRLPGVGAGRMVAPAAPFDPRDVADPAVFRKMDPLSLLAVGAAAYALRDAGIDLRAVDRDRVAVFFGIANGHLDGTEAFVTRIVRKGPGLANPALFPNLVLSAPTSHVTIALRLGGPTATINQKEVSAEGALACARDLIAAGGADLALAGGADELSAVAVRLAAETGILAPEGQTARPFDRARSGVVLGEGACCLVLEPRDAARAAGRRVLAVLDDHATAGASHSAFGWPRDPSSYLRATRELLARNGLSPADLDLVVASASGAREIDEFEAEALTRLLGEGANTRVTSIKGAVGDTGSVGALKTAVAALAIHAGKVPPTVGLTDPIRNRLGWVIGNAAAGPVRRALVSAIATGGAIVNLLLSADVEGT
jgi:3-oxoacyl-[acyl-carrier-protein] synthase II